MSVNGGCLCGSVRFEATGDPLNTRICHCRECQKAVGAAFNARILYRGDNVRIDVPYGTFHSSIDLLRGFCTRCGTSVFTHRLSSNWIGVTAGSLNDPNQFRPEAHTWVSEKQPWVVIRDGLPQFERMPPPAPS